jgi:hypothetical protein
MPYIYNDEDNNPMSESMLPADKNCHDRCPYSKICWEKFHCKGSHNPNYPYECPNYDKINDTLSDIPFSDPDIPAEELEAFDDGTDT